VSRAESCAIVPQLELQERDRDARNEKKLPHDRDDDTHRHVSYAAPADGSALCAHCADAVSWTPRDHARSEVLAGCVLVCQRGLAEFITCVERSVAGFAMAGKWGESLSICNVFICKRISPHGEPFSLDSRLARS
jgi:hypothetical protein